MTPTVATRVSRAVRFAIRIDSVPQKSERPIRLYLLYNSGFNGLAGYHFTLYISSVCQTTDRRITAADTTVKITTRACHHSSLISVVSHGADSQCIFTALHHLLWAVGCPHFAMVRMEHAVPGTSQAVPSLIGDGYQGLGGAKPPKYIGPKF